MRSESEFPSLLVGQKEERALLVDVFTEKQR